VTMNAMDGNDIVNVLATAAGVTTTINGGAGDETVNIGSDPVTVANSNLNGILGAVTVNGEAGADTLNIIDVSAAGNRRYEVTSTFVQRSNSARITYATTETLNLSAGSSNDAIVVLSTHTGVTNIQGNSGDDSFSLCNAIAGPTNLSGGDGHDQFALQGGTSLFGGVIDGGPGVNTLNYSGVTPAGVFAGFTTPVQVNLSPAAFATVLPNLLPPPFGGLAINVPGSSATGTGGIANIRNVVGGSDGDILVGDDLPNQLEGRLGADLLFGQGGNDNLLGGLGVAGNPDLPDVLFGGDGNDLVDALSGETNDAIVDNHRNFLFGGAGNDVLFARSARDQLFGEAGVDRLIMRSCLDFFGGNLGLDTGADGGSITTLALAIVNQPGAPATPPPAPLVLMPLDCNQTLIATPPVMAGPAGDNVTILAPLFLNSVETRGNLVRGYYQRFLGRTPDSAGLQHWLNVLAAGAQPEDVLSAILGSAEFFARVGNDLPAFVRTLYSDLLGRNPSDAEVAAWISVLGSASRTSVARAFTASDEFRSKLIRSWYTHYLGRSADATGLDAWLAAMRAGATQAQVQAAILASAEYRQVAGRDFSLQSGDAAPAYVRSLYGKVLGRTASEAEVQAWLRVVGL
jgi:Ca2+-binding RTX toxin-like protein